MQHAAHLARLVAFWTQDPQLHRRDFTTVALALARTPDSPRSLRTQDDEMSWLVSPPTVPSHELCAFKNNARENPRGCWLMMLGLPAYFATFFFPLPMPVRMKSGMPSPFSNRSANLKPLRLFQALR